MSIISFIMHIYSVIKYRIKNDLYEIYNIHYILLKDALWEKYQVHWPTCV